MYIVHFKDWDCELSVRRYARGRIALTLEDLSDGSPVATATVNLYKENIPDDHVFIKDWSENEGMYDALLKAGIISKFIKKVPTGYVEAYMCKLLIPIPQPLTT